MKGSPNLEQNGNKATTKDAKAEKKEEAEVSMEDPGKVGSLKDASGNPMTCRICLGDAPEPGNPFSSPCNCDGTMKYVHLKCLQRWLKSKLHTKVSGCATSILWKTLECELCKKSYTSKLLLVDIYINLNFQ